MAYTNETAQRAEPREMPQLGRLKAAAERISVAQCQVSKFIDRFHGSSPSGAAKDTITGDTYRNDLDSLFEQIGLLEATVAGLDTIG